ncbi:MAG: hypothetical protein A3J79_11755 [Elusimicrobia bacterium RIFOXYB2_FULL_62_6]|nr:MAG: hypothetical protein A3J79_11755 [Elusimicrobia bacterium RIFOXYB2_FULL_62_6]
MFKRIVFSAAALLPFFPLCAPALQLEAMNASDISGAGEIRVPAVQQAVQTPGAQGSASRNYYLDEKSYDPLLQRSPGSAQKINIIGGTIDIPGTDGTLNFARKYRQVSYQVSDLQSDVALTVYTKSIPKTLFRVLFGVAEDNGDANGGTYGDINPVTPEAPAQDPAVAMPTEADIMAQDIPQDEKERLLLQLKNSKLMIEGRVNPFRVKEMIKMLVQIMKEEKDLNGLTPQLGTPHAWSPEFTAYCREKGEMIPLTFTKLLTALASGVTSRHFKTGKEDYLIAYILSRPDGSVTMDEAFRHSYRLNNGEVYLSILTIENILSDYWRHPQRDQLAVTKKLANICNFYQGKGDKYGAWYHFHGIMLYGYVRGGLRAFIVGSIESAGSHVLTPGSEPQEDKVNSTGGKVGAKLAKAVKNQDYLTFTPDRNYCLPEVYLNLNEDFRDRLEIIQSRRFQGDLGDSRLWLKSLDGDRTGCRLEIIYSDHTGELNSDYKRIVETVDFRNGKFKPFYLNSVNPVKKARAFITCPGLAEQALDSDDPWADMNNRSAGKSVQPETASAR